MQKLKDIICELVSMAEDSTKQEYFKTLDNAGVDIINCLDELAEYREAKKQDMLKQFPCKIGSTVYRIITSARNPIVPMVVTEIRFKALRNGEVITKIVCSDDIKTKTDGCFIYYEEEIGKKVFLTIEDAEKSRKGVIASVIVDEKGKILDEVLPDNIVEQLGFQRTTVSSINKENTNTFSMPYSVLEISGTGKEEFIERYASLMEMYVIEKSEEHLVVVCKNCQVADDKKEEIYNRYLEILNALKGNVNIWLLN